MYQILTAPEHKRFPGTCGFQKFGIASAWTSTCRYRNIDDVDRHYNLSRLGTHTTRYGNQARMPQSTYEKPQGGAQGQGARMEPRVADASHCEPLRDRPRSTQTFFRQDGTCQTPKQRWQAQKQREQAWLLGLDVPPRACSPCAWKNYTMKKIIK